VGKGSLLRVPIAHGDGNYFCDDEALCRLQGEDRVAFRYVAPHGQTDEAWNVNGSLDAIAGILSEERRILGLMPHPERASEELVGSTDGARVFESMASFLEGAHA
jgi:phosphoribosylformylglycinamidine synthase